MRFVMIKVNLVIDGAARVTGVERENVIFVFCDVV